ncbi:MAG: HAMP domain-containing sensor histidine kinase [Actinomycetota bacterium]
MKGNDGEPKRRRGGLAARLLVAQTLVLLTSTLTAWTIAATVGPPLFHTHLDRASVGALSTESVHIERAYQSATSISLSLALLAALLVAMAVNVYIARRIGRSVAILAGAASEVAGGRYDVRVSSPGLGAEFDALTLGFNRMASRLGSVERTRRRLLADLGHEMRTPVATLEAGLEALEDGVATLDVGTAELLHTQTRRLTRLSEDITSVSQAEEGQVRFDRRPVQPASLVCASVDSFTEGYETKGVRLVTSIQAGLPRLLVDPERMGQVLGNLLDNALRHTPAGGIVTISAVSSPRAAEVVLSVEDTGEGIPAEHLSHIFERFYRVDTARDRTHGGSGIGLAIARALVEAHGGQLTAASPGTGQGSTFRVLLPRV